jgi:putative ABC transport system permease protein
MISYLRTLLLFYRRHLRVQPMRELMAIGGVAAGVALLFTVQVAHRSISGSFQELSRGVAGRATLELAARSPEGVDQRIAEEVERMPGVRAAAPILLEPVVAFGPKGRRALTLVGATEQVDALAGRVSLAFQRAGESSKRGLLVLAEPTARAIGAQLGANVSLLVGERSEHLALDATVSSASIGAVAESPIAASTLPIVQAVARLPGRVSRVLIEPQPGHEKQLRDALVARFGVTLNVRSVDAEASLLADAAGPEAQLTLLFSAISLFAGIIIAYNALLLASEERRPFMLQLVEIGTPDSVIVASLAFDAIVMGLAGCLVGLLVGDGISLVAYRSVPGYIAAAFAIGNQRVIDLQTILFALAGGIVAAGAAASLPALVILRSSTAAESEAVGRTLSFTRELHRSNVVAFACGALLVAGSVSVAAIMPSSTVVALVGLAAGLIICLPLILRWLLRLANTAANHTGDAPLRLSVAQLRTSAARSVALLATGAIAAFLVVVIGGCVANIKAAANTGASELLSSAELWVKPGGPENVYTTEPFHYRETQARLRAIPTVSSVLPWRDSFLDLPRRRVWVLAPPPQLSEQIAPSQLVQGSLASADRALREGGWAAISQAIASEQHTRLGGRLTLPTPSGNAHVRVAAIIANYGWLPGAIVINGAEQARLWRSSNASELAVALKPGISPKQARMAVEHALPAHSALAVKTAAERRAEVSSVLGSTLSRLNDTTIVVLIAAVVSVLTLMLGAIWQQRARLDSLMSIGMSTGQFVRLLAYETGSLLLAGCLIGIAVGFLGQDLIDGWLHQTTGASVHFEPAWALALLTLVIGAAICVLGATLAATQTGGFQARAVFSTE